jgi:hypothetical protein
MKYSFDIIIRQALPAFFRDVVNIQSSEANYAALLYHHLIQSGYSPTQLCTEMYTANLIADGSRPDLVVFDDGMSGRFNYFKDCDKNQSNTGLKKDKIRCIFEIKGGSQQHESGLGKYFSDDPLCEKLRNDEQKRKKTQNCALALDIEKLNNWATHFGASETGRNYVFLAIDMKSPKGFWSDSIREKFASYSSRNKVHLVYYAQGEKHYWYYAPSTSGEKLAVI